MIFWNDSADCAIKMDNSNGGSTFIPFFSVSSMMGYASENNITITNVETL